MIRRVWLGAVRLLGSARVATWLLAVAGLWAMVATLIPQGSASDPSVAAWSSAHQAIEPLVRAVGLHEAFTSFVFTALVVALGASTALCAWRRTKVAIGRTRALREAASSDGRSLSAGHRFEIACDRSLSSSEVLSRASNVLGRLGVRTKRRGDLLTAVSHPLSVWGSPVFHWALLALIIAVLAGSLLRSDGVMGVPVGQTKTDAPLSYTLLRTGPLHDWGSIRRSIRVDALDLDFHTGGIDRGPTPTVSVLDAAGHVVKTQRVYPNMPLQTGSLTIHVSAYGLVAGVSRVTSDGAEIGRAYALIDFSQTATEGTVPASGFIAVSDPTGKTRLKVLVTVPLDRSAGQFDTALPSKPVARVVVATLDGRPLVDRVVGPGENVQLPVGGSLHLGYLGYYARLSVVDDMSIPLLYAGLVAAMVGLSITVVARQQVVLATVVEGPEGSKLVASVRLWRNATTSRGEIEAELARALGTVEKGSVS